MPTPNLCCSQPPVETLLQPPASPSAALKSAAAQLERQMVASVAASWPSPCNAPTSNRSAAETSPSAMRLMTTGYLRAVALTLCRSHGTGVFGFDETPAHAH